MKKIIPVAALLIILAAGFYFILYPKLGIITGYTAKTMCSCRFVSNLSEETAKEIDLGFGPLFLASLEIDETHKRVNASVLGMQKKTAVFRKGLGCTLTSDAERLAAGGPSNLKTKNKQLPNYTFSDPKAQKQIAVAASGIFIDSNDINTRAVVILKSGKLIFEKYSPGIDSTTRLLGWSMSKSVTSALAGILAKQNKWHLDSALEVKAWQKDGRSEITLRNALNMTTGLLWEEDYSDVSNATIMLYETDTMGAYAAHQPGRFPPGQKWQYNSGTSNILAWKMKDFFSDKATYWQFPQQALFGPIGAASFIFETDGSGAFVGSSYCYATARDWAKLGLLYLNKGNWQGNQVIDSSWIEFSSSPAPNSEKRYGGHFWLNADDHLPNCPTNLYYMDGFQGQRVFILPDEDLVIVRLGVTYDTEQLDFDKWISNIIAACKEI